MSKSDAMPPVQSFGRTPDGHAANVYSLENAHLHVRITDYGGRMVSIQTPDRSGRMGEVLLGFDDAAAYVKAGGAFGALLGRSANRIAGGCFVLDGHEYHLPKNDHDSTLHGGPVGFDKVMWKAVSEPSSSAPALVLTHLSPDGDQGFPGDLSVEASYRLEEDSLWLELSAHTTKPTLVNLSAHPYFNLAGAENGDVLGHVVAIMADAFLPTDERQIPTGEIRAVAGTPFDFSEPKPLGARIRRADPQLIYGNGYDHCFVLGDGHARSPRLAARVADPGSGRVLEVHTNQPGIQLYTGNKLDGSVIGREGVIYRQSAGVALEAQGFPDAPHHRNFPSTVLRPGERYHAVIRYRFTKAE